MFTWICPQCGREVPPAYTDCPDCAAKTAAPPEQPPAPQAEAAPISATSAFGAMAPPPPPAAPAPPTAPPPPTAAPVAAVPSFAAQAAVYTAPPPRPRSGMPAWLMTIVFAFAFVGVGASAYWGVNYYRGSSGSSSPAAPAPFENPAKPGVKPHPLAKFIEIAGMRFIGDKKKTEARFIVINHSDAELTGLAANVTVWGRTQRSEEDAVGNLQFKVDDISPNEYKEVTVPLDTKLKIYELPDWQNVTTDLQITAPPAP